MSPPLRRPGQRAGLSRAAVLAAARTLLADGGVDALSMRALARRLGVAPNALYSHVESKTALLDELLDDALGGIAPPSADAADPIAGVEELMRATYATLVEREDLVPLFLSRQGARGPNALRLGQVMDRLLERAGVTGPATAEARRVLIVHAIGFAAFATAPGDDERPIGADAARRSFERSLRWLLAGIVTP